MTQAYFSKLWRLNRSLYHKASSVWMTRFSMDVTAYPEGYDLIPMWKWRKQC